MSSERWLRIIPVAVIMYTIAYIDRTNISLALPAMSRELHMDHQQAGSAAGIFFWGYLALQIPGGYLAQHWSAKRVVSVLLVLWGCCAVAGGLVETAREFWWARLLLGVTEGGVFPATLVLLTNWFARAERARANAYWMLCQPLALIVSAPLSGWILGRWNWRVLLIAEGALPFVWLIVWVLCIDDRPEEASWLSAKERESITATLHRETAEMDLKPSAPWLRSLVQPLVWKLVVVYFLLNCGGYGFLFWLPSAIGRARTLSSMSIGLLYSLPYVVTGIMMVLTSRHSDRTGERRNHVAVPLALGGVFLLAAVLSVGRSPLLALGLVSLAGSGSYAAIAPFWAIPAERLTRQTVGPAMGLINAIGALGGYFGPLVVGALYDRFGDFLYACGALSAALIVAAGLAMLLGRDEIREPTAVFVRNQ
jgi:sugar phosphate permease